MAHHRKGYARWGGAHRGRGEKPVQGFPLTRPQTSDEFDAPVLGLQWQWNHAPRNDAWSLTEQKGFMRLHASPSVNEEGFFKASNTLLQRTMGEESGTVTNCIDMSGTADGQVFGLCVFTGNLGLLYISQQKGIRTIGALVNKKGAEGVALKNNIVWLRAISKGNTYQFSLSEDGKKFINVGEPFMVKGWYGYRGVQVGIFNYTTETAAGYIDVDWFHYDYR